MNDILSNNIFNDVKRNLPISEEDNSFDDEILTYINSIFFDLNQIGLGPDEIFFVDQSKTWGDFSNIVGLLSAVREYIIIKVRIKFDPPSSSFVLSSYNEIANKMEWRLNFYREDMLAKEKENAK